MKLKIDLRTFAVQKIVGDFGQLPNIRDNGQHYQLYGHALAEVDFSGKGVAIRLLHPDTECRTGHIDLTYFPGRYFEGHSPLQIYCAFTEVDLMKAADYWPTGVRSLIMVIDAIENFLASPEELADGFRPLLWGWLAYTHESFLAIEQARAEERAIAKKRVASIPGAAFDPSAPPGRIDE
jgi:hypothetical protein